MFFSMSTNKLSAGYQPVFNCNKKRQSGFPTARVPVDSKFQFKGTYSHMTFGLLAWKPSIEPGCWETQPSNLTKCLAYKLRWTLGGPLGSCMLLANGCAQTHMCNFAVFHPTLLLKREEKHKKQHVRHMRLKTILTRYSNHRYPKACRQLVGASHASQRFQR